MLYSSRSDEMEMKWLRIKDDTVKFEPSVSLHGDVLLRCRHLCRESKDDNKQERVTSVFRVAFNTGYVQRDSLILQREELDGTGSRSKFQDSFRVELYFKEEQNQDGESHEDHNATAAIKPFWDHVDRRKRRLQKIARKKRKEEARKKSVAAVKDNNITTPKVIRSKDAFSLGDLPDDEEVEFDPTESENSSKTSSSPTPELKKTKKIATEENSNPSPKSELKRLEKIEEKLGLTKEEEKEERRKIEDEDTPPSSPFDVDAELKKLEISASTLDHDIDGILGDIDLDDDALNTTNTTTTGGIEEDDPDLGDLEDYLKTFENT